MKRLRQQTARTSNEIYRRTQKRNTATKKKELLNELKKLMCGVDPTTRMLKSWTDKLKKKLDYKKIKLQKFIERGRQIIVMLTLKEIRRGTEHVS